MPDPDDIPVKSITLKINPDGTREWIEWVAQAIGSQRTPDAIISAVLEDIKSLKPKMYVASAMVSLGFKSLHAPLHIGMASMAPLAQSRVHGMRTGWNQESAGDVWDHVLIFPVGGVGWTSSGRLADEQLKYMLPMYAFVLDIPVASYGKASTDPQHPIEQYSIEHALAELSMIGCRVDEQEFDATLPEYAQRFVRSSADAIDFYAKVAALPKELHPEVAEAVRSYNQAMLLAEPEPGFERYEDRSTAITLWNAIFEGMAEGAPERTTCEHCGKSSESINKKLKAYLRKLTANDSQPTSWSAFDKMRKVRHQVAHRGLRPIPGVHDFHPHPVFEDPNLHMGVVGILTMKKLARRAILDFVERNQVTPVMPT